MNRTASTLVLGALVVCRPAVSAAAADQAPRPSVEQRMQRARDAYERMDYLIVAQELQEVITDPRASDAEMLEANMLAGIVQRILGNDVDARMHFLWVLRRHPDAQLPPNQPPKIQAFFELVRQEVETTQGTSGPVAAAERPGADPAAVTSPARAPQAEVTTAAAERSAQDPAPAQESEIGPLFYSGAAVAGLGLAAVITFGTVAALNEATAWDTAQTPAIRNSAAEVAQGAWLGAIASVALVVVGAGLGVAGAL